MPAKDSLHNAIRRALEKEGWRITHDPYRLTYMKRDLYIDLGAELIAAELGEQRIAVEIKGFAGYSQVDELEKALGQYITYRTLLELSEPERRLYLAVPEAILKSFFDDGLGKLMVESQKVWMLGFDSNSEEVTRWLPKLH
jgi:hypothetical protein